MTESLKNITLFFLIAATSFGMKKCDPQTVRINEPPETLYELLTDTIRLRTERFVYRKQPADTVFVERIVIDTQIVLYCDQYADEVPASAPSETTANGCTEGIGWKATIRDNQIVSFDVTSRDTAFLPEKNSTNPDPVDMPLLTSIAKVRPQIPVMAGAKVGWSRGGKPMPCLHVQTGALYSAAGWDYTSNRPVFEAGFLFTLNPEK